MKKFLHTAFSLILVASAAKAQTDNQALSQAGLPSSLGLTMESFDANTDGSFNVLDWSTIREMQIASITIERAADGAAYKAIGHVAPLGAFFTENNYQFIDSLPLSTSYYRLKITAVDGTKQYSSVKRISSGNTMSIRCYPNPTIDYINIRTTNSKAGEYRYSVVTLDGRTVQSGVFNVNGADEQLQLNVSTLSKGMLVVQLQNVQNHSVQLFKVVKK